MKITDLTNTLSERFPLSLQEKYDNTGGQILFGDREITGILLALDIDSAIIDEALDSDINLIVTHHPLFFKPMKRITAGEPSSDLLLKLVKNEISLYSAHTNLDKVFFDKLGEVIGVENRELLIKTESLDENDSMDYGFGVRGEFSDEISLDDLLKRVKERLDLEFVIYSGNKRQRVRQIALIGGAGGSLIEKILKDRAIDCIITGDIGYHPCKIARDYGVPLIDAGHYGTERILLNFLKKDVEDCLTNLDKNSLVNVIISRKEENPFRVYI